VPPWSESMDDKVGSVSVNICIELYWDIVFIICCCLDCRFNYKDRISSFLSEVWICSVQHLRRCIENLTQPRVGGGALGHPPYENPSIAKVCDGNWFCFYFWILFQNFVDQFQLPKSFSTAWFPILLLEPNDFPCTEFRVFRSSSYLTMYLATDEA